jgi:8-oxo-dGTP diphosphatase
MEQATHRPAAFKVKFGVGRRQLRLRDGAGVLFRYTDAEGDWYFLTQRAPGLTHAGEWAYPGGLVDRDEAPMITAIRELEEECGVRAAQLKGARIAATVEQVDHTRTYTTFVVELLADFDARDCLSSEVSDAAWFHAEEIDAMQSELLPKFRELWAAIQPSDGTAQHA